MGLTGSSALAGRESSRPPLVGREEELRVLGVGLEDALNGRGGLYVISGTAGMGKTRLAEWTAERAREQGARVLLGVAVWAVARNEIGNLVDRFL